MLECAIPLTKRLGGKGGSLRSGEVASPDGLSLHRLGFCTGMGDERFDCGLAFLLCVSDERSCELVCDLDGPPRFLARLAEHVRHGFGALQVRHEFGESFAR